MILAECIATPNGNAVMATPRQQISTPRLMARDQDFYNFNRSLSAYRQSFGSKDDVLILQPQDFQFFRYFNQAQ